MEAERKRKHDEFVELISVVVGVVLMGIIVMGILFAVIWVLTH